MVGAGRDQLSVATSDMDSLSTCEIPGRLGLYLRRIGPLS